MRSHARLASVFAAVAMYAMLPIVRADGTITIHLANDGPDNLVVTLYDRNARHRQLVLSGQIIYGNASISTSITADSSAQGHLTWRAMSTDRDMPRCGHRDVLHIDDGATVHVKADSACPHHHR